MIACRTDFSAPGLGMSNFTPGLIPARPRGEHVRSKDCGNMSLAAIGRRAYENKKAVATGAPCAVCPLNNMLLAKIPFLRERASNRI